ncbi:hypothetical protein ACLB2K_028678 [Fragaria x ananassa]
MTCIIQTSRSGALILGLAGPFQVLALGQLVNWAPYIMLDKRLLSLYDLVLLLACVHNSDPSLVPPYMTTCLRTQQLAASIWPQQMDIVASKLIIKTFIVHLEIDHSFEINLLFDIYSLSDHSIKLSMASVDFHQKPDDERYYYSTQKSSGGSSYGGAAKFLAAGAVGSTLFVLSGLTLTATVIALIMATPVVVLFSPILVPAGLALFLAATGLVLSGGCGVAAVMAFVRLYKYISGYAAAQKTNYGYGQNFYHPIK